MALGCIVRAANVSLVVAMSPLLETQEHTASALNLQIQCLRFIGTIRECRSLVENCTETMSSMVEEVNMQETDVHPAFRLLPSSFSFSDLTDKELCSEALAVAHRWPVTETT